MADYIDPPLEAEPSLKYEEMVAELQARGRTGRPPTRT
jgi:hypothetical protein